MCLGGSIGSLSSNLSSVAQHCLWRLTTVTVAESGVIGFNFRGQFVPKTSNDEDSTPAGFTYILQGHTSAGTVFDVMPLPYPPDDDGSELVRALNRLVNGQDSLLGQPAVSYAAEDITRASLGLGPRGIEMPTPSLAPHGASGVIPSGGLSMM